MFRNNNYYFFYQNHSDSILGLKIDISNQIFNITDRIGFASHHQFVFFIYMLLYFLYLADQFLIFVNDSNGKFPLKFKICSFICLYFRQHFINFGRTLSLSSCSVNDSSRSLQNHGVLYKSFPSPGQYNFI